MHVPEIHMYFTLDNACTVATCIYINIGKSLYIQMVIHVGFFVMNAGNYTNYCKHYRDIS